MAISFGRLEVKDNSIIWLVVGAAVFWLAILFPETTGHLLTAMKHLGQSVMSRLSR
jgi:hypothetical protein